MKLRDYLFIFIALFCFSLKAEPTVYGKLWISVESQDTSSGTEIDMVSNASRLGVKGSMDFGEGLEAIYQAEYEVDPVDGTADEKNGRTFKQRNSFVGIKGSYGTLFLGTHDTATKRSIAKIDLFNDLAGDIKNILWGENRSRKIVQWSSPSLRGFEVNLMAIMEDEEDEAYSLSINWSGNFVGNKAKFSLAFDSEVPQKGYFFDTTRFSASIPLGKPSTLGVIWQESEDTTGKFDDDGYIISLKSKLIEKLSLKLMYGESDMIKSGGELIGFGFDYKIAKPLKLYVNYVEKNFDDIGKSSEEIMFGIQYKFDIGLF